MDVNGTVPTVDPASIEAIAILVANMVQEANGTAVHFPPCRRTPSNDARRGF